MRNDPLAAHPSNSTALIEGDRAVSYGELADLVATTAGGLVAAGVVKGDRVAVLGTNDVGFVTGLLAAQLIGAVACPITERNPELVINDRIQAVAPRALVASPAAVEAATAAVEAGLIDGARIGTATGSPSADLQPLPDAGRATAVEVERSDAGAILHTSGIVGAPRAAVLTYENLAVSQERMVNAGRGLTAGDISLAALPLTHVLGLNMSLLSSLRVGAAVVLQPSWDADAALRLITRHEITHVVGVPPMWAAWSAAAESGRATREDMKSVTFARTGASTLHPSVAEGVHRIFGLELAQGYGLTETAGTVTFEPTARQHPGSVGRPLDGVEVRLVEDGQPVERGDRGEIWIRTGSVFQGYLDDAAATAEVLISDGWCRTGDVGIQDEDGTLYLVGRSKDLINVSGFNVYPAEVESVLATHPGIHEAIVVGEPHEITGERVIAYVTSIDGGKVDTESIVAHCRQHLSRYKIPHAIHLVERLPLTAIGKRVRSELR